MTRTGVGGIRSTRTGMNSRAARTAVQNLKHARAFSTTRRDEARPRVERSLTATSSAEGVRAGCTRWSRKYRWSSTYTAGPSASPPHAACCKPPLLPNNRHPHSVLLARAGGGALAPCSRGGLACPHCAGRYAYYKASVDSGVCGHEALRHQYTAVIPMPPMATHRSHATAAMPAVLAPACHALSTCRPRWTACATA